MSESTNRVSKSVAIRIFDQRQGLAYALPVLPLAFLLGPMAILQGIYAKHFGLTLTTIASVLLISRVFDAVTDPIIGYYADKYHAMSGSRKPFILTGGILFIISSWFLYVPPANVSTEYFLVWFLAFYLAYTLFDIPHLAWGSELANDSQEKNKIFGLRTFCMFFGGLLFYAMPLLPVFETDEFTPQTLKWSVLTAGVLMAPLLYFCVRAVPNPPVITKSRNRSSKVPTLPQKKENIKIVLRLILANKPLRTLTAAHICTGFGSGMWYLLLFLFVDTFLDLGKQFALVYVISICFSLIALKLWYVLANQFGKQISWAAGMAMVLIGLIGTGLLSPDNTGWLSLLLCMILINSGFAAFGVMVPSLLSDVIDYGTWKFGVDYSATYFSLYTLVNKTVFAIGGALSLMIVDWYGFDPIFTTHADSEIFGLRLGIAWIPSLMIVVSIVCIVRIPITFRHHQTIRRRLDARISHDKSSEHAAGDQILPSVFKHIRD